MNDRLLKVVSLFSGIGGFEEGLNQSSINYEIVFASEIDKYARISYSQNFESHNLHGDIKKVDEYTIPDHDLLCAGFPCQSFSIAGKREGFEDIRGTLFFDIVRILKAKRPKYFLLENVKNLISHDGTSTIKTILHSLSELGYAIDFSVINSNEAGLPQNRDRTYIVGIYGKESMIFKEDSRNKIVTKLKEWSNENNLNSFNFFNNLSFDDEKLNIIDVLENDVDEAFFIKSPKIKRFLSETTINSNMERANKIIKLFDIPKDVHNDLERQRRVYSIYGISPTLLARSDSTKILLNMNEEYAIRKFTPFENFRAQGFGEQFISRLKEAGISNTQLYKQSGNAVSPPVISKIVSELISEGLDTVKSFKFIDLFSGIGGFRIAMEQLGGECVFSSDIDTHARQTYFHNFNEMPFGDITKINEQDIPDHDVLCAGFPCQPFSIGGKRLGFEDTRGTLFFEVSRIVNAKKPKVVFLENVSGIVSHDGGRTIDVIITTLKELGYKPYTKIMNALNYGVPQNRNRWYCVAIRNDIKTREYKFPEMQELTYRVEDIIQPIVHKEYGITKIASDNIDKHLGSFKKTNRFYESELLLANEIRNSRCSFRGDGISPCLTAKMGTGGNNVPVIVNEKRKLTERECLAIMGFPSWYKIKQNTMQSYKQIGNSVVVPVIQKIAENFVSLI